MHGEGNIAQRVKFFKLQLALHGGQKILFQALVPVSYTHLSFCRSMLHSPA